MNAITDIIKQFQKANTISLFWHVNPDADCVGSCMALKNVLERIGKKAVIYSENTLKEHLSFFNAEYEILNSGKDYSQSDLSICLDCGSLERTGNASILFKNSPITANIDHHETNPHFAHINIVDTSAAATAEILFRIFEKWNVSITKETAFNLYAAIIADTRCFRASSVTSRTYEICSKLLSTGIDGFAISNHLFSSISETVMRIRNKAMCDMEMFADKQIAVATISEDDIKGYGLSTHANYNGIPMDLAGIIGVKVAVLLTQYGDEVRGELRSTYDTDVSKIAITLGGGGHKNASGFIFAGTIEKAKSAVVDEAIKVCNV